MQNSDERNSSSSKNSMYRSMVARTGSSEWRGAARTKIETAILDGSPSVTESRKAKPELHNYHYETALEDIKMEEQTITAEEPGQARRYSKASASEEAINIYQANNIEEDEELDEEACSDGKTQDDLNKTTDDPTVATEGDDEEPDIPGIYRNWEPMDDVELENNDAAVNRIGEVEMDSNAFEKARARSLAENSEQARRRARCFKISGVLILVAMVLLPLVIVLAVTRAEKDSHKNGAVIVIPSRSTGTLLPLADPVISNGADKVVVKFRENVIVPEGHTATPTVYDGPDCGTGKFEGGANDITGQTKYDVEAVLYHTGALGNDEASHMGLILEWEPDKVQQSPLYTDWGTAKSNPYSTMDICVGLAIVDSDGQRVHYEETYLMTTWMGYTLQKVRPVPITPDTN